MVTSKVLIDGYIFPGCPTYKIHLVLMEIWVSRSCFKNSRVKDFLMDIWLYFSIIILKTWQTICLSSVPGTSSHKLRSQMCFSYLLPCCQASLYLNLKSDNFEAVKRELAVCSLFDLWHKSKLPCAAEKSHWI